MQKNIGLLTNIILILSIIFLILNKAISKGNYTCNSYILNVYLYVALAFSLVAFIVKQLEQHNVNVNSNYRLYMLILFIITIASIIGIHFIDNIYITNLLWLVLIISFAVSIYPMYLILSNENIFMKTLISVVFIVLILTAIAFLKPEYISLSWGNGLLVALTCGIIIHLVQYFIGGTSSKFNLLLSYFFVLLFSLYLLYDTKVLQVKAANCKNMLDNLKIYPNYPRESLGIILDILNLFTNLGNINRN